MNNRALRFPASLRLLALLALLLGPLAVTRAARAADLLGLYFGAAYGQAHVRARPDAVIQQSTGPLGGLDMTHSAFKVMAGMKPLPFLGVEVAYMDLGKVSVIGQPIAASSGLTPVTSMNSERASQRGETAFALLYLPVPLIDIYVKAGLSRITTDFGVTYTAYLPGVGACPIDNPNCGVLGTFNVAHDSTDTEFAYGAGLQWKLGDWAVRGEYERFEAAGANPSLISLGMTYWVQ